MKKAPTPTNSSTSATLNTTRTALARALSRMPRISTTLTAATMSRAGRLKATTKSPMWGAWAAISGVLAAVCRSVAIQAGKSRLKAPRRNERK